METSLSCGPRAILLAFVLAAAISLPGCGGDEKPSLSGMPQSGSGEEWFWRDRLCVRPEPLAAIVPLPNLDTEVSQIFDEIGSRPPGTLEKEIAALSALGEQAIPFIAERTRSAERSLRYAAATALGRIDSPHTQEPLLVLLRDEWSTVAILAADILTEKGKPWTLPRMIKTIGPFPVDFNPVLMVRVKAAAALIGHHNYSGVPFLIKILKENTPAEEPKRDWYETQRLAWEKEEALEVLSSLSGDTFGFVIDSPRPRQAEAALRFERWWHEAADSFWARTPALEDPLLVAEIEEMIAALSTFQIRNKDCAQYMLRMLGPPVLPFLVTALTDDDITESDFYVKFHALDIIAELAPVAVRRAADLSASVGACLKDRSPAIRAQACRTLGRLGRASSLPFLEQVLGDGDSDVRLKAVEAIGLIGGFESERCLTDLLANTMQGQLRTEILAALVRFSSRHVDGLLTELLSHDPSRQEWALQKVIDLTGDDFGFRLGDPLAVRAEAVDKIGRTLRGLGR